MIRPHDHNLKNSDMNLNIRLLKSEYLKICIGYNGSSKLPSPSEIMLRV